MNNLRILVADDHALVRQGLRSVLEAKTAWTVCGEAQDGREAVNLALKLRPDIVLLDVTMPELNGLDATRQICRRLPGTPILILTMHESEELCGEAIQAGASGCVLKSDSPRLLLAAVEAVAAGGKYFTRPTGHATQSGGPRVGGGSLVLPRLSAREREIVQLLAEGRTSKEIASRLGIAFKTVDAHRTNIMRRLNVHAVADLVRYAVRERIIQA
jgi:DNA-binding NarL/FixJ family response regulator